MNRHKDQTHSNKIMKNGPSKNVFARKASSCQDEAIGAKTFLLGSWEDWFRDMSPTVHVHMHQIHMHVGLMAIKL